MLNLNKIIKINFLLVLILFFASCDKDFEQLNIDPNSVSKDNFNPAFLLTTAEIIITYDYEVDIFYGSGMMQHFAALSESGSSWAEGDKYSYHRGHNNMLWSSQYSTGNGSVKLLQDIIQNTKDDERAINLYQMARILKVLNFQRLTDTYGDIPYSEAGLAYYEQIGKPKYDKQEEIYMDMLNELDDAVNKIDLNQRNFEEHEIAYKGDLEKWKRLGNSLMLRLGMRLSKVQPATAESWVKKAYSKGVFNSNDDNLFIKFLDKTGTVGILTNSLSYNLRVNGPETPKISKTFFDFLKLHQDPRLQYTVGVYSDPWDVSTGNFDPAVQKGLRNGLTIRTVLQEPDYDPDALGGQHQYSGIRRDVYAKVDGIKMLVTYAETQLLLAEAAVRGWIQADAKKLYEDGVRGAMKMLSQYDEIATISDSEIDTYLENYPFVGTQNTDDAIEQISTQYWAATFMSGIETWANWRRTGYPKLIPVNFPNNITNGQIPRRLYYPQDEMALNADSYNEAVARQGPDDFMTRVWWDSK